MTTIYVQGENRLFDKNWIDNDNKSLCCNYVHSLVSQMVYTLTSFVIILECVSPLFGILFTLLATRTVKDHTLMGALTRVLSEEYKKSVELCYNILRAFLVSFLSRRTVGESNI